jgi:large repetitive protein
MKRLSTLAAAAAAASLFAGCTVHQADVPPVNGPSELALSLTVQATPDSLNQDGGSQSAIRVTARGPNGAPIAGLALRLDMMVNGVVADFGTLSSRSIVTGSDGVATTVFTAPPPNPFGQSGTCGLAPGTCLQIIATPTSTNFDTVNSQAVTIRLVPPGVILPPAGTPTAAFSVTPIPVSLNLPATFDASASTPGANATIVSYAWTFGDGGAAGGQVVQHTFTSVGTFNVTLTVTNDRGLAASTVQAVTVGQAPAPTGDFDFSPREPAPGDTVIFNAERVQPGPGRRVVSYSWNFGDPASGPDNTAAGSLVSHVFSRAGTYRVVLSVLDDAGGRFVTQQDVTVE